MVVMTRKYSELTKDVPTSWSYSKLPTSHGTTPLRIDLGRNDGNIVLRVSYQDPKTGEKLVNVDDGMTEKAIDLLVERGEKTMIGWIAKQVILRVDNN